MAFRGYFALDGVEIVNNSRVVSHLARTAPLVDDWAELGVPLVLVEGPPGLYDPDELIAADGNTWVPGLLPQDGSGLYETETEVPSACQLIEVLPGMFNVPETSTEVRPGMFTPPNGAMRWSDGLFEIDPECAESETFGDCSIEVRHDDSWPGLAALLGDNPYRLQTAPWFSSRVPESGEFGGVWLMDVKGLGPTPAARSISEMVGPGAAAGRHRDASRKLSFDAVLIATTNAGLEFGMSWLACRLRDLATSAAGARMTYLSAHPGESRAVPADLVREVYGVVLTEAPSVSAVAATAGPQATMYRVQWEMAVLSPYAYLPTVPVAVEWDTIEVEPIQWVHAAECPEPDDDMPVLFSATCTPEVVDVVSSPPPSCGGCLPVCEISRSRFRVPTLEYPRRCNETAVSVLVENTGTEPVTIQFYWQRCGAGTSDRQLFPLQIAGLPAGASVELDSITGRYTAEYDGKKRRPVGIVGTPTGAPWRPIILDRNSCWELVAEAADDSEFDVSLTLADREP